MSFAGTTAAPQTHTFDQQTLQDVALACVEGIVGALASNDAKRAKHIAERLAAVLNASPLSLPPALECTCQRTMGCAHRRYGDHLKASECFKLALAQPDGEDTFQRVNTLMLQSNSLSSLQRFDLALESASHAQRLLQAMLFEQPHLMSTGADDSSVQMVRLVVAVHFRVGVLKQQLGNSAGARDACHAIEVSKTLLGRFSLGQQMMRIVREDGTLIPVSDQVTMRTLSDNLNITGNLNASGSAVASTAPAAPQRAQLAASSIYSSNSSGLSSLMPRLRVPEPDVTDPTESLRELSQLTDAPWNARGAWEQQPARAALDGTRDMWRGEFAPGRGRLQLPDVETELSRAGAAGGGAMNPPFSAAASHEAWSAQSSRARHHGWGHDLAKLDVHRQTEGIGTFAGTLEESAWVRRGSHATIERVPGSYAASPNVRDSGMHVHSASRFDEAAAVPGPGWLPGDILIRDGGSSCAAVASVRIADPDMVSSANADQITGNHARQTVPLWSEHQASPIVDMLHQYLTQQHERVQEVNALRDSAVVLAITVDDAAPDNLIQQPPSPQRENDSSPQPSNARKSVVGQAAQDDDVAGFLFSRSLPEKELRLASRFKDANTDDRMIDFTVDDFLCECASMTSAIETDLRRELEHISQRPESELQRELENITSRGMVYAGNT